MTTSRMSGLKAAALVFALASLTLNFGLIDLIDGFTGYVDQSRNQVLDVGWGAVFGIILPLGMLSQLRRPDRRIAGVQQTATVGFALALAVLLLVLHAAARTPGWRIPAVSASLAAGAWAISCLLAPAVSAGSAGHAWAWAALVWAAFALASAAWPRTRDRPVTAEARLQGA